jgi:hypothetical protein
MVGGLLRHLWQRHRPCSRLVCSRARKVKCLNVPGQTRCLACERHRVDCTFAWREAYLVRSERAAANVMGAPGSVATTSSSLGSMSLVNFTSVSCRIVREHPI